MPHGFTVDETKFRDSAFEAGQRDQPRFFDHFRNVDLRHEFEVGAGLTSDKLRTMQPEPMQKVAPVKASIRSEE